MPVRKALYWTVFWIGVAVICNLVIYYQFGQQKGLEFMTGYVIEESLSVDNLFVFLILFRYFKIPAKHQRCVLTWGIIGVIILRGVFILLGSTLVTHFEFVLYIFGAILIYSGYKINFEKETDIHPEKNIVLRFFKKFSRTTHEMQGDRFFIKKDNKNFATPLLVCLIVIESTDVVFAIDSIPAIFAITTDPLIVFSSNILAVLGLRSIYFLLAATAGRFLFVKRGVGLILAFVGVKMLLPLVNPAYQISTFVSLLVIISVLAVSVIVSMAMAKRQG